MNTELFIARRIYKSDNKNSKQVSSPAVRIAVAGIAVGLAVMIVAVSIIIGFKKEVRDKVIGFDSHIRIAGFSDENGYEQMPIAVSEDLKEKLLGNRAIGHIRSFITKPGIIKTDDNFQGVVLKGVAEDYDWHFFKNSLVEGDIIDYNDTSGVNQILISKTIADKMLFKTGDSFTVYFAQEPVRARKFTVKGIYDTNFEDYDKLFVICRFDLLSRLNNWDEDMASGIEVFVKEYDKLDETAQNLFFEMASYKDRLGNKLYARSIKEINPAIFNWLSLLDMNVWVILILMILVSGFTMISGLLIIILERANMIGMLKSMGTKNHSVRKIFLYLSFFLIGKGMIWGNILGTTICLIQKHFEILKLDPATYYLSSVPINFNLWNLLLLNIGTLLVSLFMMIAPSYLVAKITPAKSIKFE